MKWNDAGPVAGWQALWAAAPPPEWQPPTSFCQTNGW